jgi:hypothetical protein
MRFILTLAIVTLGTTDLLAGPGDGREDSRYRDMLSRLEIRCPRGTRLLVSGTSEGGIEESCVTADGVRHGYFIRWFADGETWATVGRYDRGKPVGRWMHFNPAGQRISDDPMRPYRRSRAGA